MEECLQAGRDLWNIGWMEESNSSAARFWRVATISVTRQIQATEVKNQKNEISF